MKFYFLFYSYLFLDLRGEENCNVFLLNSSLIMGFMQWRTRGGASPRPPLRVPPLRGGGTPGGVLLILHLPQAIYILHCIAFTQTKSFKKRIKYILIHNITLQSFV